MVSGQRRHFADEHTLTKIEYNSEDTHNTCDICRAELAGLVGYRCSECDFDVHDKCANYFEESISFFAHPWHSLKLSRVPADSVGCTCDLCRGTCPPGSFVYRCPQCAFDVHPLCTMLPQVIRSPLHTDHDLFMTPGSGCCSACREQLPIWQYRCGFCLFKLHIACVGGVPGEGSTGDQHPFTGAAGSQGGGGGRQSRRAQVKFLIKRAVDIALATATSELATKTIEILSYAFS